jgi:hypothetical protein
MSGIGKALIVNDRYITGSAYVLSMHEREFKLTQFERQ